MKNIIILITVLLSINAYSQKKYVKDLDSLFLKNGKVLVGKDGNMTKDKLKFCTGADFKNCEKYEKKDIDRITLGWSAAVKKRFAKHNMVIYHRQYKSIYNPKNDKYNLYNLVNKGEKYNIYSHTRVSANHNSTDFRIITKSTSDTMAYSFNVRKSDMNNIKSYLEYFKSCNYLKELVNDKKKYKKFKKDKILNTSEFFKKLNECAN
jgi:hypothetical protein